MNIFGTKILWDQILKGSEDVPLNVLAKVPAREIKIVKKLQYLHFKVVK